jgi:hypothetical protein
LAGHQQAIGTFLTDHDLRVVCDPVCGEGGETTMFVPLNVWNQFGGNPAGSGYRLVSSKTLFDGHLQLQTTAKSPTETQCILAAVTNHRGVVPDNQLTFLCHADSISSVIEASHHPPNILQGCQQAMPRGPSEAVVTKFLRHALAVDAVGVPELEARA